MSIPDDKKFLQESVDVKTSRLKAVDYNDGYVRMNGIFLQADLVNGNGRLYESEWFNPYIRDEIVPRVNANKSLGELDHPDYFAVMAKKATHKITSLTQSGSNWLGELELLKNELSRDYYQILACIDQNVAIGVSSRAIGSTYTSRGIEYVDRDGFQMSTPADIVLDPSAPDAYITAIVEGKDFLYKFVSDDGAKFLDESKKLIKKSKSLEEADARVHALQRFQLLQAFNKFYK